MGKNLLKPAILGGLLEKEKHITISFMEWLWIGLVTGIIGFVVSYGAVLLLPVFRS